MDLLGLQQHNLHDKSSEVCINARSPAASQPFIGLVAEQTTVKWPIGRAVVCNITVMIT